MPAGFEFINPGLLLVTPDQVWKGGVSEPRNPLVQRLFGFLQLGEREGSGGPTILRAWSEQHWRPPELVEDIKNSELHLKLRLVSLLPKESLDAVRAELGGAFDTQDELGRVALVTAHAEHGVTHARVAGLTRAHSRDVTIKLQELVRKGLLVASGSVRTRHYALPKHGEPTETSPAMGQSMGQSSETGSRGWAPAADQTERLLAYCSGDWRTVAQIAVHLGRTEETVRKRYIPRLIKGGLLLRRYPEEPRHPLQAYRTAAGAPSH